MKACKEHWDQLRDKIKERGLDHLVSKDGEQAINRLKKELDDQHHIQDPLLSAWFSIMNNALSMGGMYLLGRDENGNHYCPMCEGNKHTKIEGFSCASEWFIERSVDDQYNKAKEAGLLNNN